MSSSDELTPPAGLIAGKYRITRLLGRGGMGAVWEGLHETLGTRVAVKFIDSEHASSNEVRQRFVNEARAAARLRSKHVVQVYDQGVGEDGRPYIVMEFLGGEPLDSRLDRLGRLSPSETARITLHVCRALSKAHDAGIIHRDLKPENIFLVHDEEDRTDVAKVVDFGIAKFTEASPSGSSSTRTGAVLGTPQYMSPEQARGLRTVDHRTDLWALGVIVYRALTGALPFRGEAVGDLLVNICTANVPVPSSISPDVPAGFDEWTRRALAREPGDRFQTAAELTDTLAELCGLETRLAGGPPSIDSAPPRERVSKGAVTASPFATTPAPVPARNRSPLVLGVLFFVVMALAIVGGRVLFRRTPEAVPETRAVATSPGLVPSAGPSAKVADAPEVTPASAAAATAPSSTVMDVAPHAAPPSEKVIRHSGFAPRPSENAAPKRQKNPDLLGY